MLGGNAAAFHACHDLFLFVVTIEIGDVDGHAVADEAVAGIGKDRLRIRRFASHQGDDGTGADMRLRGRHVRRLGQAG